MCVVDLVEYGKFIVVGIDGFLGVVGGDDLCDVSFGVEGEIYCYYVW